MALFEEELSRLRGHAAAVAQVTSSRMGLVSAGNDLQLILWAKTPLVWRHHEKMNWCLDAQACLDSYDNLPRLATSESKVFVAGLSNEILG